MNTGLVRSPKEFKRFLILFCFMVAIPGYAQKLYSLDELYLIGETGLEFYKYKGIHGLTKFVEEHGFEEWIIEDSTFYYKNGDHGEQMIAFSPPQHNYRFATIQSGIALKHVKELKDKYQRIDIAPLHPGHILYTNDDVPYVIEVRLDGEKEVYEFIFEEKEKYNLCLSCEENQCKTRKIK